MVVVVALPPIALIHRIITATPTATTLPIPGSPRNPRIIWLCEHWH